ncbi:DUF2207 domain-containing protein [Periweissella ghanensis]|uniref:DUF2207 domain-containing protein n=1 Tax=Periweissella ghanensis TaxID=467997 RepID=A0ABN8BNQ3_9LACO|nr:DUF2207 domain-containing protein [Periweissella ghanensis]MCM0601738.1 DUF2207 domain-containing protein [Periweissella ghanensis]CAH0418170.1 hypothetical protein WGH24286_00586 [Periweissella ghanensis]
MKKWALIVCSVLVSLFVFHMKPVYADDDYEITHFNEHINVNADGSAALNYQLTYKFDDAMHGFLIRQGLEKGLQVKGPVVAKVNNQAIGKYTGGNQGLEIVNGDASQTFKVHYPIKAGQTYQLNVQYQLGNFAQRYTDIGEINNFVIGENWEVDLNNVDITVQLPHGQQKLFGTYTHTKSTGKFVGDAQAGLYKLTAPQIDAGQAVELHSYFDQQTLVQAPQIKHAQLAHFKAVEAKIAANIKRAQRIVVLAQWVAGILVILGLICAIYARQYWVKRRNRALGSYVPLHNYELPSQLAPAIVANQLYDSGVDVNEAFNATMMDLTARHYLAVGQKVDLGKFVNSRKATNNLEFTLLKLDDHLLPFELLVIQILFGEDYTNQIGAKVAVKDFKHAHSPVVKRYGKLLNKLSDTLRTDSQDNKIIDTQANFFYRSMKGFAAVLATIGAIIYGGLLLLSTNMVVNSVTIISGILLVIIAIGLIGFAARRTLLYQTDHWRIAQDWFDFGSMLKNVGEFDIKQVPDVTLWDRYMGYAVVLGAGAEVMHALAKYVPANEGLNDNLVPMYLAFNAMNTNNAYIGSTLASSGSSSNGGLGGGMSSGGGGASSGGGAF